MIVTHKPLIFFKLGISLKNTKYQGFHCKLYQDISKHDITSLAVVISKLGSFYVFIDQTAPYNSHHLRTEFSQAVQIVG